MNHINSKWKHPDNEIDRYRKFKNVDEMTRDEIKTVKETEFDFDERSFGGYVICDPAWYTEIPQNCKLETIPISFRNGNYRADAICDGFVAENGDIYVSEHEMDIGICIEWEL